MLLGNEDYIIYQEKFRTFFRRDFDFTALSINFQADFFRVIYLYFNGGLYFDFDYDFNQACFNKIKELRSEMKHFTGNIQKFTNFQADSNPLYVAQPYDEILKDYILSMAQNPDWPGTIHDEVRMPVLNLTSYCKHRNDETWV